MKVVVHRTASGAVWEDLDPTALSQYSVEITGAVRDSENDDHNYDILHEAVDFLNTVTKDDGWLACPNCKSTDVQMQMWVTANGETIVEEVEAASSFCAKCKDSFPTDALIRVPAPTADPPTVRQQPTGRVLIAIQEGVLSVVGDDGVEIEHERLELTPHAAQRLIGELYAAMSECGECGRGWDLCACEATDEPEGGNVG